MSVISRARTVPFWSLSLLTLGLLLMQLQPATAQLRIDDALDPEEVLEEEIEAQHQDGILLLTLPKKEEVKPRVIEVNVS